MCTPGRTDVQAATRLYYLLEDTTITDDVFTWPGAGFSKAPIFLRSFLLSIFPYFYDDVPVILI